MTHPTEAEPRRHSATILSTRSAVFAAAILLSLPAASEDALCSNPAPCTVDGAEKDDAATVQARAAAGQGPRNGIASDRRLKHTIKQIGSMPNGLPVYSFKFEWEDRVRVGLVAQDLLERPEHRKAVLTMSNGLLGIDYASLGLRMATEIEWMAHGYEALKADYFSPETLAEEQLPKLNNRSNGH